MIYSQEIIKYLQQHGVNFPTTDGSTLDKITEASLDRIRRHVKDSRETPFGIVTAYRHNEQTGEVLPGSQTKQDDLRGVIKSHNLAFIELRGFWHQSVMGRPQPGQFYGVNLNSKQLPSSMRRQIRKIFKGRDGGLYLRRTKDRDAELTKDAKSAQPRFLVPLNELRMIVSERSLFVIGSSQDLMWRLRERYKQDAVVYSGPDTEGKVMLLNRDGSSVSIGGYHPDRLMDIYSRWKGKRFTFLEDRTRNFMDTPAWVRSA